MITLSDHLQDVDQSWLGVKTHAGFKFRVPGSGVRVEVSGVGLGKADPRGTVLGVGCRVEGVGCRV